MTKEEAKDVLVKLFPDFLAVWESDDNLYKEEDGGYTYHGLFSEFSHYFRDNIHGFSDKQLKELFFQVEKWDSEETATFEDWTSGNVDDIQALSNAVSTCFLENIAGEGLTERIKPFMDAKSYEYYSLYDH